MLRSWLERLVSRSKGVRYNISSEISSLELLVFFWRLVLPLCRGLLSLRKIAFLGHGVRFLFKRRLIVGSFCKIGDHCYFDCLATNGVRLGRGVSLGRYGKIRATASLSELGRGVLIEDYVGIGDFFYLGAFGGIEIGAETIIGERFTVHSDNHITSDVDVSIRRQGTVALPVRIGSNCWIGSNVTVLGGVDIGKDSIVGAGSVVTKSVPDGSVVVGNPSRLIKSRY